MSGHLIILQGDQFSFNSTCEKHSGGTGTLSNTGQQDNFVKINNIPIVCYGATNSASCSECTYTMTINSVPQDFVYINSVLIAAQASGGSSSGCHTCNPIPSSTPINDFIKINL